MPSEGKMPGLITPQQLHAQAEAKAMAEAKKAYEAARKADEERRELHEVFMSREVRPDGMERLMAAVTRAAENGQTELMVLRFPSSYLSDGGRAVNNFDPSWPQTLAGYAKHAYEFYEKELRAHGYKLRAQVMDYPNGMPGDIGMFLSW